MSLFSAVRVCSGEILLDGANIARVPLNRLRSSLSIIPQDPVLFSGTIRFNLDPGNTVDNDKIWKLERAENSAVAATCGELTQPA